MRTRGFARAVALLMMLLVLLAMPLLFGADGWGHRFYYIQEEYKQWVDPEGIRPVKAFSMVSQPEIFYCSALGEEPDLSGVVFRLEYKDGGVEQTGFMQARTVMQISYECSGSWLNYGMVLRTNPEPTLGKRREALFFNNAQTGGYQANSDGSFETPVFEDNTELLRVYVDATNLTIEEYLKKFPLPVLHPGAPVHLDIAEGSEERLVFTPEQDGVYLFRFAGGKDNEGCSVKILGHNGRLHGSFGDSGLGLYDGWGIPVHSVALRMCAGERVVMRCAFGYVYSEVKEGPLTASVTGPLETQRLRAGKKVNFTGSCVVRPEIPDEGIYAYHINDAFTVPVDNLEHGFKGAYNVLYPNPMPYIWYYNGERLANGDWVVEAGGTLHPYTVMDTDNRELLPNSESWEGQHGTAPEFVAVTGEDAGAIELVRKKAPSMPEGFTLRAGETVPFSAFLTSDTMGTWNFSPLGGTKSTSVFSVFARDGVLMLQAKSPGTVRLGATCYSKTLHTTITVAD